MLVEGTVVTMDAERRVIADGAVAVAGDRIAGVGDAAELRARHPDAQRIGGARRYVIPGLIDCHNHIAQALCRESTVEDFPNIYRIYIPAEAIQSTDDVRVSARVAFAQLLRAGVTTMTETTCTVAHEEPIAETVMETGIRCALARGMWDRESRLAGNYEQITGKSWYRDDPAALADDLDYTKEFFAKWFAKGEGRLRPWVHNLGVPSCSDERYLATDELVQEWGTGIMTHINRDREEIELSVSLFGHRPLEHLASIGALTERLVAIHAMLTTDREIDLMAEAGAKLAHAPVVCTDIMSAVTRVPLMRARGITVGLGCDTIINDLLKLMRIAHIMHNQAAMPLFDPYGFSCNDAFEMGTIDAGQAAAVGRRDRVAGGGQGGRHHGDRRQQRAAHSVDGPGGHPGAIRGGDRRRVHHRGRTAGDARGPAAHHRRGRAPRRGRGAGRPHDRRDGAPPLRAARHQRRLPVMAPQP